MGFLVPNTLGIFLPEDFVVAVPFAWRPVSPDRHKGTQPHQLLVCLNDILVALCLDILPEMALQRWHSIFPCPDRVSFEYLTPSDANMCIN